MFEKLKQKYDDYQFKKAVGVSRKDVIKLAGILLQREDGEPVQIVLRDGTAGDIFMTKFETSFQTVAVTAKYDDFTQFVVCIPTRLGWKDVLHYSNWRVITPGRWQELLKSLVDHFVKGAKK